MNHCRKKKILHYIPGFYYGGVETCFMNWFRNIDKEKFEFSLLIHTNDQGNKYLEEFKLNGGLVFCIDKPVDFIKFFYGLANVFYQNKFDIVHCHTPKMGFAFLFLAQINRIKKRILHSHTTQFDRENYMFIKKITKRIVKYFATDYLACSEEAGRWLYGKNPKKKVITIKNAIQSNNYLFDKRKRDEYRTMLKLNGLFVIGHVGRFCYAKNHEFIINVFNHILKKHENSILILIGDGVLKNSIEAKVRELEIDDKVIFLGFREDIPELLQAIDIFFFPSHYEGLPISIIESQMAGLPTIISDKIPKEAIISDLVDRISINENTEAWSEIILNYKDGYNRKSPLKNIEHSGYDIRYAIKDLEQIYYVEDS